jgi:hypothetical protein
VTGSLAELAVALTQIGEITEEEAAAVFRRSCRGDLNDEEVDRMTTLCPELCPVLG